MPKSAERNRTYMQEYRAKRRSEAIEYLGGKCEWCGSEQELEFDHINPEDKEFKISGYTGSIESFWIEVKKCQLLCQSCHQFKTLSLERRADCPSIAQYKRGCRCEGCVSEMKDARHRWNLQYRGRK